MGDFSKNDISNAAVSFINGEPTNEVFNQV